MALFPKAQRVNLTAGAIRTFQAKPGQQQAFLWDTEVPWLAVRATAKGHKAFIFQSTLNRMTPRLTIGDVNAWGIDQARKEARRLQTLIDQGIDPREAKAEQAAARRQAKLAREAEQRRQAEAAVREALTLGDLWSAYITAREGKWTEQYRRDHERFAKPPGAHPNGKPYPAGPINPLLAHPVVAITAATLIAWQEDEASTRPTAAANAFRLLRACLRWAASQPAYHDLIKPDLLLTREVREAVPRVKSKDDVLQKEQLRAWFTAVQQLTPPVINAYLQALLLTGARREELANLQWSQVDFAWRSLVIGDKIEGERIVPLTPHVARLLSALPRRNQWVFSSPAAASGRLQEPSGAHRRALAAAGLPHVSLHGLRRSFGTLAEWTECPVGVTAQIMGHRPSALAEKHYRRRPLDLLRKWHTSIEAFILTEAGIEVPKDDDQGARLRIVA